MIEDLRNEKERPVISIFYKMMVFSTKFFTAQLSLVLAKQVIHSGEVYIPTNEDEIYKVQILRASGDSCIDAREKLRRVFLKTYFDLSPSAN